VPENDAQGSTIALTDTTGSIVRSYTYDPDGNATSTGSGATTNLQYDGGHVVGSLDHFAARYYDPGTARWTQQDPIRHLTDVQQANRYLYAGDDPVTFADRSGTDILGIGSYLSKHKKKIIRGLHTLYTGLSTADLIGSCIETGAAAAEAGGPVGAAAGCIVGGGYSYVTDKAIDSTGVFDEG
jgi:RHS repeat-associated protein